MTTPRIQRLGALVLTLGACREPAAEPVPGIEPAPTTAVQPVVTTTTVPVAAPPVTPAPQAPAAPPPPADPPIDPPTEVAPAEPEPAEPEPVLTGREFDPAEVASLEDLDVELPQWAASSHEDTTFPRSWALEAGAADPTHGPALDAGDTIAVEYDVSDKMRWLAKKTIQDQGGAKIVMHATAEIHRTDGEVVVYALVEGDRRALCIAREGGDEGARLRCDAAISADPAPPTARTKPCPEAQLARVVVGPVGSAGKNGRAIQLAGMVALPGRCKLVADSAELGLKDVDGDGRPEVLARWIATLPEWEQSRSGGRVQMSTDTEWLSIHRLDLGRQLVAQVGESIENEESPTAQVLRVRLAVAKDGIHRDIAIDARDDSTHPCTSGDGECHVIERALLVYAPPEDTWRPPATHVFVEERVFDRG